MRINPVYKYIKKIYIGTSYRLHRSLPTHNFRRLKFNSINQIGNHLRSPLAVPVCSSVLATGDDATQEARRRVKETKTRGHEDGSRADAYWLLTAKCRAWCFKLLIIVGTGLRDARRGGEFWGPIRPPTSHLAINGPVCIVEVWSRNQTDA
jgi:hypothetical protein